MLSLRLIARSFSYMGSKFEEVVMLVSYTTALVNNILYRFIVSSPANILSSLVDILHGFIKKECGIVREKEINAKVFLRIYDILGSERLTDLLSTLQASLSKLLSSASLTAAASSSEQLTQTLLLIAYASESPALIRAVFSCLKEVVAKQNGSEKDNGNLNWEFFHYEVSNNTEIIAHCAAKDFASNYAKIIATMPKPIVEKKLLPLSWPKSEFFNLQNTPSNLNLLFEKLGHNLLAGGTEETNELNLRTALTQLLNISQTTQQFRNRHSSLYMSFN